MSVSRVLLEEFGQPEYTGENRCTPCTVLNLAIAVGVAAVVGRFRRGLRLPVVLGAVAVIYLRGYLVPGTPELTKRYLPDEVLALFGKEPERMETVETDVPEDVRQLAAARAGGVADE